MRLLLKGDARRIPLPDNSVDAVVCDPPYGIKFMGKAWDAAHIEHRTRSIARKSPSREYQHRSGNRYRKIEHESAAQAAGEYDRSLSANRAYQAWCESWAVEVLRVLKPGGHLLASCSPRTVHRLTSGIEDAGLEIRDCLMWIHGQGFPKSLDVELAIDRRYIGPLELWEWRIQRDHLGEGTQLKPAFEPIVLARKPIPRGVAWSVLHDGASGLQVDRCLIDANGHKGRWPANVLLDEAAAAQLDAQSGRLASGANPTRRGTDKFRDVYGAFPGQQHCVARRGEDSGGASRFFYCAKASKLERMGTTHPTVKPLDLMEYLVRLVTPPGGIVLDPFMGSGTTGRAARAGGFRFIGLDLEREYIQDAAKRTTGVQRSLV